MSPRPARQPGAARLAVVGAQSPEGGEVRAALAEIGIPGKFVDLFGTTTQETVLSEYNGEARLIQAPDPSEIQGHDVVFLCEAGDSAERILSLAGGGTLVIDTVGCGPESGEVPMVHMDINPEAAGDGRGVLAVPHPLSAVLAEVLFPLERAHGVKQATAVFLRPAADFGEEGLRELQEQTVRLLNFSSLPTETFEKQLTFNLIPQRLMTLKDPELDRRVVREVGRILGWKDDRLALRLVNVPVFHGHAAYLRVELERDAGMEEVTETLREQMTPDVPETPMEAAGKRRTSVAEISREQSGGFWLWIVAGEAGNATAKQAVRLAGAMVGL